MECTEVRTLLHALADGELHAPAAARVEQHLASCAGCTAQLAELCALQRALRERAPYHRAPLELRRRLLGGTRRRLAWQPALALAAGVLLTLTLQTLLPRADAVENEVIANHVRSLQAAHLSDVASSDRHTVRPWFAGKLDYAPPVRDLVAQGFALTGGRLDYVDHRAVAGLVYRHGPHVINVFVWPATHAAADGTATRDGFNLVYWTRDGMRWWAISDLGADELAQLAGLLRQPET